MRILITDEETIGHFLFLSKPFVFRPPHHSQAHGLIQSGYQATGHESHRKQENNAHVHDCPLSSITNDERRLQRFLFAEATGPSITKEPVCLNGRRRAEFSVAWINRDRPPEPSRYRHVSSHMIHKLTQQLRCVLKTASATEPCAMRLQCKSSAPPCGCRNIRRRTMPGPPADRTNNSVLVRSMRISVGGVFVVVRVVPVRDPLSHIAGHVLHSIRGITVRQ